MVKFNPFSSSKSKSKTSSTSTSTKWSKSPLSPLRSNSYNSINAAPANALLQLKLPSPSLLINEPARLVLDRKPSPVLIDDVPSTSTYGVGGVGGVGKGKGKRKGLGIGIGLRGIEEGGGGGGEERIGEGERPLSSPWIEVDEEEIEVEEGKKKVRELIELEKLEKKLGSIQFDEVIILELLRECSDLIRNRGSTTLGIFRPYRLAESNDSIRKLKGLWLAYVEEFDATKDIWGKMVSKDGKLERFRDELKYSGVHDVVAVLKWGLRHLVYSTSFDGSTPSPFSPSSSTSLQLKWYQTYLTLSSTSSHPTNAFSSILLPLLPRTSQDILLEICYILESLAAQSELNAMTARKLSRTLGIYIFGHCSTLINWDKVKEKEGRGFEMLYGVWREAGDALEGVFKAYLRGQKSLPSRLEEVLGDFPFGSLPSSPSSPTSPSSPHSASTIGTELGVKGKGKATTQGRKVRVLRIDIETQGDWRVRNEGIKGIINDQGDGLVKTSSSSSSGSGSSNGGRRGRRTPVEILSAALEGKINVENGLKEDQEEEEEGGENASREWEILVEEGRIGGDPTRLLSDETRRILDLVGLTGPPQSASPASPLEKELLSVLDSPTIVEESPKVPTNKWTRSSSEFNLSSSSSYSIPISNYASNSLGARGNVRTNSSDSNLTRSETGLGFPSLSNSTIVEVPSSSSSTSTSNPITNSNSNTTKKSRRVTPSWENFSSSGFSEGLNQFGLDAPVTPLKPSPVITERNKKLGGMKRSASIRLGFNLLPPPPPPPPLSLASLRREEESKVVRDHLTSILKITIFELDEEFPDVWIDTLVDPISSNWPSFIISDLLPSIINRLSSSSSQPIEKILIIENLVPFKTFNSSTIISNTTTSTSTRSIPSNTSTKSGWNKRVSGMFSSSRNLNGFTHGGSGGMSTSSSVASFMDHSNTSHNSLKRSIRNKTLIEPILETTTTTNIISPVQPTKKSSSIKVPSLKSIKSTKSTPLSATAPSFSPAPSIPPPVPVLINRTPILFPISIPPLSPSSLQSSSTPPLRSSNSPHPNSTTISRPYTPDISIPGTPSRPTRNPSRISLSSNHTETSFNSRRVSLVDLEPGNGSPANVNMGIVGREEDILIMIGDKLEGVEGRRKRVDSRQSEIVFNGAAAVSALGLEGVKFEKEEEVKEEVHLKNESKSVEVGAMVPTAELEKEEMEGEEEEQSFHSPLFSTPGSIESELAFSTPAGLLTSLPSPLPPPGLILIPVVCSSNEVEEISSARELPVAQTSTEVTEALQISEVKEISVVEKDSSASEKLVVETLEVKEEKVQIVVESSAPEVRRPSLSTSSSLSPIMIKPLSALSTPPHTPTKAKLTPRSESMTTPKSTSAITSISNLAVPIIVGTTLSPSISSTSSAHTILPVVEVVGISKSIRLSTTPSPSSTNTLTPTKKFTNAIGSLLRRKKSATPNNKKLSPLGGIIITEKEKEKALKETQKREAKEAKKSVPAPVSSVRKRVLEIEAEEVAKLAEGRTSTTPAEEVAKKGSPKTTNEVVPTLDGAKAQLSLIHQDVAVLTSNNTHELDQSVSPKSISLSPSSMPRSPSESTIIPLPTVNSFIPTTTNATTTEMPPLERDEEEQPEVMRVVRLASDASVDSTISFRTADTHYE